jgi:hypothetical protein
LEHHAGGIIRAASVAWSSALLSDFHKQEVALYPGEPNDKVSHFVAAIKPKNLEKYYLFEMRGPVVVPMADHVLLGWDEAIYKHHVQRFYKPNSTSAQAVLLGLGLFSIAKATSNYVGGPTQVILVRSNGIWQPYDAADISELERRLTEVDAKLAEIVLKFSDSGTSDVEFKKLLADFESWALQFRDDYIRRTLVTSTASFNIEGSPAALIHRAADGEEKQP